MIIGSANRLTAMMGSEGDKEAEGKNARERQRIRLYRKGHEAVILSDVAFQDVGAWT